MENQSLSRWDSNVFKKKHRNSPAILFMLIAAFLFTNLQSLQAQTEKVPASPIICPAKDEDMFTRVNIPNLELHKLRVQSTATAEFDITFGPGAQAEPDAQAAFQYALDIWANQIVSPVPIKVYVDFADLGPGVLASAGPTYNVINFPGAPEEDVLYPAALANALAGEVLFPDEDYDLVVNLGTGIPWYFGLDGNTPSGLYDFVTVALHEAGHGLGFTTVRGYSGGVGTLRSNGNPSVYGLFIVDSGGDYLIDFPDPSTELGDAFTGGDIFMDGTFAKAALGGDRPELYAPSTWAGGSSLAHWDEASFPAGDPNSLMTPQVGSAESNFDIGDITRGLFKDMGWVINDAEAPPLVASPASLSEELFVDDTLFRTIDISNISDTLITGYSSINSGAITLAFVEPDTLSLASGGTDSLTVGIITAGVAKGIYSDTVFIETVEVESQIAIPVTVRVLDGTEVPSIEASPDSLVETLEQLQVSTQSLTISNTGDADLNFSISVNDSLGGFSSLVAQSNEVFAAKSVVKEAYPVASESLKGSALIRPISGTYNRVVTSLYATDFESFTPGDLNGQLGWISQYEDNWVISSDNPDDGLQHLRGISDGLGSTRSGNILAISPTVTPGDEVFMVMSARVNIQGSGVTWEVIPQSPTAESVNTRLRFNPDGTIDVLVDPEGFVPVNATIPSGYFDLKIVVDKDDSSFYIYFDDELVFSGTGYAPEIEQVVFLSLMETTGSTFDVDNFEITDGDPDAFFLSVTPNSGTVPFGSSTTVDVKFDARTLDPGFYESALSIFSNDTVNSPVEVPAELTVVQPPTISVDPDSLFAAVNVQVDDPPVKSDTFTISNSGESVLEFSAALGAIDFTPSSVTSSIAYESLDMALYGVGNNEDVTEKLAGAPKRLGLKKAESGQVSNSTFSDSIYYDSGIAFPDDFSGVQTAAYTTAMNFDVESDFTLTAVRNGFRTEALTDPVVILEIYKGGTTPNDGDLLLTQTIEQASEEGIVIAEVLSESLSFTAGESFWVVHKYPDGIEFPQGVDANASQRPDTYYFSSDGGSTYTASGFVFYTRALTGGVEEPYIALEPSTGSVNPGESIDVAVTFNGESLANGLYDTDIVISSNDPVNPSTSVSTQFDVSGQLSEILLSDEYLLFNSVFLGTEKERSFTITNDGLALLNVSNISSDNPDFSVDVSSTTLEAGESQEINVTFAPSSLGSINGIITVESDASNASELIVVVNGVGTEPPLAAFNPSEVSDSTDAGTTIVSEIALENAGNSPLIFSFPDLTVASILADPNVQLNDTKRIEFSDFSASQEKGYKDTRVGSPVVYSVGTDNGFGYTWIDSDEAGGPIYNFTDITASGTEITTTLGGDGTTELPMTFPFEFYGETYASLFVNANGFVAFEEPQTFSPWTNTQIPTEDDVNNLIAGLWGDLEPQNFNGSVHYQDFGDRFIIQWTEAALFLGTDTETVTFQIVLYDDGNADVFYEDVETAPFINSATVGIENGDGTDGAQVAFNTPYIEDGLAVRFIKPSISLTPFISDVSPLSGVVPAGGSRSLDVTLDATALNDGVYYDELTVSSNAPVDTASTALFELTVVGYPELEVTLDTVAFDSLFVGLSSEASFQLANVGTKALEISGLSNSNADFELDTIAPISLQPDQTLIVGVEFAPTSVGFISDEVVITSNDAFGNDVKPVYLSGVGVDPPVINLSPDSIMTAVYESDSTTETVSISNTGGSPLSYSLSPPYFAKAGEANQTGEQYERLEFAKIRSKEALDSREGPKFLNASGGPGTFGYTWVDNNSGGPAYNYIDITSIGQLANVGGDGDETVALPFDFPFFGNIEDSVTIGANGFLTFAPLVGINYVNDQIPSPDNPNLFIAPLWDDLEPQNGGGVYYYGTSEYFIVQYDSVPGFGFPPFLPIPDPVSFQVILYPDGGIKMQYENVNSTIRTSSTVGLEGPLGLSGLQVIFNTEYLTEELAISFTPPVSGSVAPGETDEVPVTLFSEGLEGGNTYSGDITVSSNDPVDPELSIPVDLEVISLPEVLSFTLINAELNEEIGPLEEGDIINIDNYATNSFSIVANVDTAVDVGSVVFDFNEVSGFQTENILPYALAGDQSGGTVYNGVELPKGINTVTATPYASSGGNGEAGIGLTVNFEVIDNSPDLCYGGSVMDYSPGTRKNGRALPASRSNPQKALGAPQENDSYNFVALGFGGSIEIQLECEVMDHEGSDLLIIETSFRDADQECFTYPEKAMVEASADGVSWSVIASEICRDGEVDLAAGGLSSANFIRITDTSNPADFRGGNADGYDLDGIVVINNIGDSTQAAMVADMTEELNNVANEEDVELLAYPNPVEDFAKFALNGYGDNLETTLYNLKGEAVFQQNASIDQGTKTGQIDMRGLTKGLYYLRITKANGAILTQMKILKM